MRLDKTKMETIMAGQVGKPRWTLTEWSAGRGVSVPWVSNLLTLAEDGYDFTEAKVLRVAETFGVDVSDILADAVAVPSEN